MQATESTQTWTETDPRTHYLQGLNFLGSSFLKVKAGTTDHCATVVNAQSRHLQWPQKQGSGTNYLPDLCSFKPSGQAQPSPQVRRDTLGSPRNLSNPHLARKLRDPERGDSPVIQQHRRAPSCPFGAGGSRLHP
ncbi:hypothetical protein LEMLEM_LOCUS10069 [Lemmus lemmus]